jgi:hypothetical protein
MLQTLGVYAGPHVKQAQPSASASETTALQVGVEFANCDSCLTNIPASMKGGGGC